MKPVLPLFSLLSLSLVLAACGGGGGGGTSNVSGSQECDPGDYRPVAPAGLGVAGPMDGTWRVVASELIGDARTRNPMIFAGWLAMGDPIEFREGLKYDGDDPAEPGSPGGPGTPSQTGLTANVEFFCNEQAAGLTLYGFGFNYVSAGSGSGAVRVCGIFGTTNANEAVGVIVDEQVYALGALPLVDRFMVYEVTLERVTFQPAQIESEEGRLPMASLPLDSASVAATSASVPTGPTK